VTIDDPKAYTKPWTVRVNQRIMPDQELLVGTRYWEGAVRVEGTAAGRPVAGRGYVELVGYGE